MLSVESRLRFFLSSPNHCLTLMNSELRDLVFDELDVFAREPEPVVETECSVSSDCACSSDGVG